MNSLYFPHEEQKKKQKNKQLAYHPKKTWKTQHPVFFQLWVREKRIGSSERYFSEFELFLKVGIL